MRNLIYVSNLNILVIYIDMRILVRYNLNTNTRSGDE